VLDVRNFKVNGKKESAEFGIIVVRARPKFTAGSIKYFALDFAKGTCH
jgi:hypothetical protein